jgi:hypothetical protein
VKRRDFITLLSGGGHMATCGARAAACRGISQRHVAKLMETVSGRVLAGPE